MGPRSGMRPRHNAILDVRHTLFFNTRSSVERAAPLKPLHGAAAGAYTATACVSARCGNRTSAVEENGDTAATLQRNVILAVHSSPYSPFTRSFSLSLALPFLQLRCARPPSAGQCCPAAVRMPTPVQRADEEAESCRLVDAVTQQPRGLSLSPLSPPPLFPFPCAAQWSAAAARGRAAAAASPALLLPTAVRVLLREKTTTVDRKAARRAHACLSPSPSPSPSPCLPPRRSPRPPLQCARSPLPQDCPRPPPPTCRRAWRGTRLASVHLSLSLSSFPGMPLALPC